MLRGSPQAPNVRPYSRPHRLLFVSSSTMGICVECICPWKHVWLSESKAFMGSWSHRNILLCNQLCQTKLRTLTMKPGAHRQSCCLCEATWQAGMSIAPGFVRNTRGATFPAVGQRLIMGPLQTCKEWATRPAMLTVSSQSVFSKMPIIILYYFYNKKCNY